MNVSRPSTAAAGRIAGQHDVPEEAERAAAVDPAGLEQLVGDGPLMYWRMKKTPNALTRPGTITAVQPVDPARAAPSACRAG